MQLNKETLKEFINEELEDVFFTNISKRKEAERLIELGAKWQAEKMYSEEEVKLAFIEGHNVCRCITDNTYESKECFEEWFKQFKKK